MRKKNNQRKHPLNADSKRQAHAQLKGYLYQIWHSVDAWLDLADDEILYLECAEDFDIVSGKDATVTQVKHTKRKITLRSQEVNDAINNFWELQTNNPRRRVKFRFLTKSKIGKEQGDPFGTDKTGLALWQRCSGDEASIEKISDFLQTDGKISAEVNDFLKTSSPQEIYEQLIEPITWDTDSKPVSYVVQSINEKLVLHGDKQPIQIPPAEAKKVVDGLLKEALTVTTQKENRELTKARFLEIFEKQTTVRVPIRQYIRSQQQINLKPILDHLKKEIVGYLSELTIQYQSSMQIDIPPLFLDVVVPRTELLTRIQDKLQSDGIAIIQGGVDKGKTTLANLTANAIDGNWFWLKLTNIDSSQVAVLLKKLANEVSQESAKVNVVIDDLNLQPQKLQVYEDDLGVVVYRILERGAKLLITSQYEPPKDLIRHLGLSSTVVIDVPNFTLPEIEQFAVQMGCPTNDIKTWITFIQAHTGGHPRLVHARLVRLQNEDWKQQDTIEGIWQTPPEVIEERVQAQQLIANLPEDQREFLYRLSLMFTEFRRDYALNIGEIRESIPYTGAVLNQLVGPWIDRVDETYYTISPLLKDAAKQIWSDDKIKGLHAHIANAILKTNELTITEARAVFWHSIRGKNKKCLIAVIWSLITISHDNWEIVSKEFSFLIPMKIDLPEKLFIGDAFVKYMIRFLQYRVAAEVKPEFAPKILEVWDKETRTQQQNPEYQLLRLMLSIEALRYNQVSLPAKQMVNYLKEVIEITDTLEDAQDLHDYFLKQMGEHKTEKSNIFNILFSFVYTRPPVYVPFLSELIDALDELQSNIRALLLADFENDTPNSRVLIDSVWLSESGREKPDWTKCLQVFDKVIEKTIAWGYPHFAAAGARGKAIIYDEYLYERDTAHKVLQDFVSKAGPSPIIEEEQAVIYLHQERYKEALDIYERILPEWNPPSGQLDVMPPEGCRRAAMCAAHLDDWKKAATFFEDGVTRTRKIENPERYIGFHADAGFAHFKAGSILNCIKQLHLALKNFEKLPQDNTDLTYFTLKKRLAGTIGWIAYHENENYTSESHEPSVAFCSNQETNEEVLNLPDSPIEMIWLALSQIEYKFGHDTAVLAHALRITDRDTYPQQHFSLVLLKTKYDFRNRTFNELPQRIQQLANACDSIRKCHQSAKGIGEEETTHFIPIETLPDFTSVANITLMLVASLLFQLPTGIDTHHTLATWRANSEKLPIKENMRVALDLIETALSGDVNNALTVMKTANTKYEKRLIAVLKVIHTIETSPENLFYAHILIATALINNLTWLEPVVNVLAGLLSAQWLEKIKFRAALKMPAVTIPEIEQACKSSETGKKKIGQILLAVHPAVSVRVAPDTLQQFRSWTESDQKQGPATRKNPAAQRLIKAMEKPPHLTDEDIEVLNQSIKEGKIPIKFDSPFESDESENNE